MSESIQLDNFDVNGILKCQNVIIVKEDMVKIKIHINDKVLLNNNSDKMIN